jgi:hypothetical protein
MNTRNDQTAGTVIASNPPITNNTSELALNLTSYQISRIITFIAHEPSYIFARRRSIALITINIIGMAFSIASTLNDGRGLVYAGLSLVIFSAITRTFMTYGIYRLNTPERERILTRAQQLPEEVKTIPCWHRTVGIYAPLASIVLGVIGLALLTPNNKKTSETLSIIGAFTTEILASPTENYYIEQTKMLFRIRELFDNTQQLPAPPTTTANPGTSNTSLRSSSASSQSNNTLFNSFKELAVGIPYHSLQHP